MSPQTRFYTVAPGRRTNAVAIVYPFFFLLFVALLSGSVAAIAVMALAWVGVSALLDAPEGVAIDDDGLTRWLGLGMRRRMRWSEVKDLVVAEQSATVVSDAWQCTLDDRLSGWREAARHVAERLGRIEDTGPVPPEADEAAVEAWLGLPPGGRLHLRRRIGLELRLLLLIYGIGMLGAMRSRAFWVAALLGGVPFVAALAWRDRRLAREVRADATGLHVRLRSGWCSVGWEAVLHASHSLGLSDARLDTEAGSFYLPATMDGRTQLITAVRTLLEAREHGQRLPRLADDGAVPDTALSRVTGTPPDAERGLSEVSAP